MDAWQYFCRRLWIVALVLMMAYVSVDTIIHLGTTYTVSTEHLYLPPAADLSSPTGYALGQRDEILPYVGMDGYHWVMQTQDMLAKGEARVRWVDYDNYHTPQITAPEKEPGREVHWSSSFRWWVALLAWVERAFGGVALPYAVEDVVPFANTMLILLMVIFIAPTLARRFGSGLAALFLFGMGAIGPLYESFSEGKSDHHGLASLSALLTVLFLLGGAAGWVRTDGGAATLSPVRAWMPSRWQALGGAILAGLVFCLGLWIVSGGKSPALAADLLTIAFLNLVFTLFLWFRTGLRSNDQAASPAEENVSPPPLLTGKNAPPALFAWLPTPSSLLATVLLLGSVFTILCGLIYYYCLSEATFLVTWLPITHAAALLSWAWRASTVAALTLPTLSICLFGLAIINIFLALLLLFKQPYALPKEKPVKGQKSDTPTGPRLLAWLPNRAQARNWFIASGVAGGVGLWVSTASEAPVLAEIGLGALLATGLFARGTSPQSPAKADPALWRVWGWSGAATSIFFYLLEYFPSHLGMRLEVNHPLYAFAWAGGGEILFRVSRWWAGGKLAEAPRDWAWLGGSAFAILIVPTIIYLFANKVFWIASWSDNSRFLFIFHEDYIAEFKDMRRYLDSMYAGGSGRYTFAVLNPLILLAVPMLAWLCKYSRPVLLGLLAVGLAFYDVLLISFHHYLFNQNEFPLDYYTWPMLAVPLAAGVFLLWLWEPWPDFPRPCKALIALSLPGGLLTMFLSLREMRWMEIGYAIWLPALVGVILALYLHPGYRWTVARKSALGIFLACVLLPGPVLTMMDWVRWHGTAPMSDVEIMEIVTRDVSQRLRARLGSDTGVVVSGPTTTTWMTYWGGFKGLGTLYWENLDGLKADMAIYSAKTPEEALALIKKYGVTHIAIYSWDPFYKEYARLAQNMHRPIVDAEYAAEGPLRGWLNVHAKTSDQVDPAAAEIPKIQDAFIYSMIEHAQIPNWLRPIYYPMPTDANLRGQYVQIYEVTPDQTPKEEAVRLAQEQLTVGSPEGVRSALNNINAALKVDPTYLPALIYGAHVFSLIASNPALASTNNQPLSAADMTAINQNFSQVFSSVIQGIHANLGQADTLALDDRVELAIAFVQANQIEDAKQQIIACIRAANLHDLRRLTPEQLYNFISFMRQLGLLDVRPGLASVILSFLNDYQRVQFMLETANTDMQTNRWSEAAGLLEAAHARSPESIPALVELARFRATAHDAALRNGPAAVALALHAHELDHGQNMDVLDVLGCAYAEAGQFALAETTEKLAADKAEAALKGNVSPQDRALLTDRANQYRARATAFHNQQPFHQ